MRCNSSFVILICLLLVMTGCKSYKKQQDEMPDNRHKGTIHISADESFKPVLDEQAKVYEANYRGTRIMIQYKPEAECLKDLMVDSIRMIIATRSYNEDEKKLMVDSMNISPQSMIVARDAITIIVNPKAQDSVFTMADIRAILKGSFKKNLI